MDHHQADSLISRLVDGGIIQNRRERIAVEMAKALLQGSGAWGYNDLWREALAYADAGTPRWTRRPTRSWR